MLFKLTVWRWQRASANVDELGMTRNAHISKVVFESIIFEDQIKTRTRGIATSRSTTRMVAIDGVVPDEGQAFTSVVKNAWVQLFWKAVTLR